MPIFRGKLAFWLRLFQCQSPCRQEVYLKEAKVEEKQLLTVKCLPVILPSQAEEKKLVTPCDLIAMNMLAVSECLYCDLVADLATRFEGVSTSSL